MDHLSPLRPAGFASHQPLGRFIPVRDPGATRGYCCCIFFQEGVQNVPLPECRLATGPSPGSTPLPCRVKADVTDFSFFLGTFPFLHAPRRTDHASRDFPRAVVFVLNHFLGKHTGPGYPASPKGAMPKPDPHQKKQTKRPNERKRK